MLSKLINLFKQNKTPRKYKIRIEGVRVRTLQDGTKRYQACVVNKGKRLYKTFASPLSAETWRERNKRYNWR